MLPPRWKAITESQHPWEREALDFVRQRLPDHEPYRAWANFEFVADDGRIYEVDLLVLTPKGFFLVEIKSRPGTLEGDSHTWTWTTPEGRRISTDNPLILADRKAKRLKSLLARQTSCRKVRVPFLQPLVFLSAEKLSFHLDPSAQQGVYLRDRDADGGSAAQPGIVAALSRWSPGAHDDPGARRVDRPVAKAISRAMEEAGIRPSQRSRRVGDYVLSALLEEGPTYQDWSAEHASLKRVWKRVRLFPLALGATEAARQQLQRAAEREYRILQGIRHPGIASAENFTIHERGPALLFDFDPKAVRLDHFLRQRERLGPDLALGLLRQIAEVLRYAHEKKLVHRGLSPQSILVSDTDSPSPRVQIYNWQTATRDSGSSGASSRVSGTAHPEQLVEDASLVYIAPEVLAGNEAPGESADVFSLGAIAFRLFADRPPATSLLQRDEILRPSRGLDLSAAVDGVGKELRDLVLYSTHPDITARTDSVADFLEQLELVEEELTAPEEEPVRDPSEARAGDRLPGGFTVRKRLGRGSSAVAFLVDQGEGEAVLKVAATPEDNGRVRDEAAILRKLRHERIVAFYDLLEVGDRTAILMAKAGERTLGQRLREEGRLHVELLQRFGEELLQVLAWLEDEGIAHRDIKPDNIGVTTGTAKERLHIVLFDFSLSRTPADNIRAGTRPYLEPFLSLRTPPRWDVHAERFAAAMTLYEMATGTLPHWGDGQSDPALIDDEVTLDSELLEADLRETLGEFFARALRRDFRQRFDTSEEMLIAWRRAFERAERRPERQEAEHERALLQALQETTPDSQLALLPLSTRVLTALERVGIRTPAELLSIPVARLYRMRGVGNRTRREIRHLVAALSHRLPAIEPRPEAAGLVVSEIAAAEEERADQVSIDILYNRILPPKARSDSEDKVLRLLLGTAETVRQGEALPDGEAPREGEAPAEPPHADANTAAHPTTLWPSQTDVSTTVHLTRARIGQIVARARQRWGKMPMVTAVRDEIARLLDANGGVMAARELALALLASRGSAVRDEARRERTALAVARAAVEDGARAAGAPIPRPPRRQAHPHCPHPGDRRLGRASGRDRRSPRRGGSTAEPGAGPPGAGGDAVSAGSPRRPRPPGADRRRHLEERRRLHAPRALPSRHAGRPCRQARPRRLPRRARADRRGRSRARSQPLPRGGGGSREAAPRRSHPRGRLGSRLARRRRPRPRRLHHHPVAGAPHLQRVVFAASLRHRGAAGRDHTRGRRRAALRGAARARAAQRRFPGPHRAASGAVPGREGAGKSLSSAQPQPRGPPAARHARRGGGGGGGLEGRPPGRRRAARHRRLAEPPHPGGPVAAARAGGSGRAREPVAAHLSGPAGALRCARADRRAARPRRAPWRPAQRLAAGPQR